MRGLKRLGRFGTLSQVLVALSRVRGLKLPEDVKTCIEDLVALSRVRGLKPEVGDGAG